MEMGLPQQAAAGIRTWIPLVPKYSLLGTRSQKLFLSALTSERLYPLASSCYKQLPQVLTGAGLQLPLLSERRSHGFLLTTPHPQGSMLPADIPLPKHTHTHTVVLPGSLTSSKPAQR